MTRGEIWWIDFGIPYGSEPGYRRPVVIVQNDTFNASEIQTTVVIPISSNLNLAEYENNVLLSKNVTKLSKDSVVVTPQIGVVDKSRLIEKISKLGFFEMQKISAGIRNLLNV